MSAASAKGRGSGESSRSGTSSQRRSQKSGQGSAQNLATAVRGAMEQFKSLTGRTPEAVTGARSLEDGQGWSVLVDVVELDRIPSSTSVLATYRVDLDSDGSITAYERLRRYTRGATDPT
jgi:Gas vesicle synthesis protein GvpO